jgi:hypothetical protein
MLYNFFHSECYIGFLKSSIMFQGESCSIIGRALNCCTIRCETFIRIYSDIGNLKTSTSILDSSSSIACMALDNCSIFYKTFLLERYIKKGFIIGQSDSIVCKVFNVLQLLL